MGWPRTLTNSPLIIKKITSFLTGVAVDFASLDALDLGWLMQDFLWIRLTVWCCAFGFGEVAVVGWPYCWFFLTIAELRMISRWAWDACHIFTRIATIFVFLFLIFFFYFFFGGVALYSHQCPFGWLFWWPPSVPVTVVWFVLLHRAILMSEGIPMMAVQYVIAGCMSVWSSLVMVWSVFESLMAAAGV